MIYFNNETVLEKDYNYTVTGLKSSYDFIRILKEPALNRVSGNNVICIATYQPFPLQIEYSHIGYFDNLEDFFKTDKKEWSGTDSMLFKSVKSEQEALDIINDIKKVHFK